ncbi:MAG: hypothetical protein HQL98_09490 [Magnetococcales bacterium]|nr:hypothetical protein [Magnetococcales bacterium]
MALSSLLILIEGLTVPGDPPLGVGSPTLARLSAVGSTGTVVAPQGVRGLSWDLLAPDQPGGGGLPLGYLAALGAGLDPDPDRLWALLDFIHLRQIRDRLIFSASGRAMPSPPERAALLQAMEGVLAEAGWRVHPVCETADGPVLLSTSHPMAVHTVSLDGLDGASFLDHQPSGPDGLTLLALLTHGQMILARHPLNQRRGRDREPALNTPWIWGIGTGRAWPSPAHPAVPHGLCVSSRPEWAGVARGAGFSVQIASPVPDEAFFLDFLTRVEQSEAMPGVLYLHTPIHWLRAGGVERRLDWLKSLDTHLLVPLAALLASRGARLLVVGDGVAEAPQVVWVQAQGRKLVARPWFWSRRVLGQGKSIDCHGLRSKWLT